MTRILSRRRRILVPVAYEPNAIKYHLAGRLLYAYLGFICDEQHSGELVAYGDFSPFGAYGTTFATV